MDNFLLPFWIFFVFINSHYCFGSTFAEQGVEDLETARIKWDGIVKSLDVPLDYSYGYSDTQEDNVIVTVEADNVSTVKPYWYGKDEIVKNISTYFTVEDLFDHIESSFNDSVVTDVAATYDTTLGYPSGITITYSDETSISHRISPLTFYTLIQRDLDTHRQLWEGYSMVDYDYTSQVSCFCFQSFTTPKRVEVRAGEVVATTDMETNETSEEFISLQMAFDDVQVAIDNRYHRIDVTFNATLGYPSSSSYDIDPGMADEEHSVTIFDVINMGIVTNPLPQEIVKGGQATTLSSIETSADETIVTSADENIPPANQQVENITTNNVMNGIESDAVMSHGRYGQLQTLSYLLCSFFGMIFI